jgi:uncharacterized repeat protein (TIGR04076 family)
VGIPNHYSHTLDCSGTRIPTAERKEREEMKEIELEIYEGESCPRHKVGQKFKYPEDNGKHCLWLLYSASHMIQVLRHDGRLGWTYKDTLYEKTIDKEGGSTEYVRCLTQRPQESF